MRLVWFSNVFTFLLVSSEETVRGTVTGIRGEVIIFLPLFSLLFLQPTGWQYRVVHHQNVCVWCCLSLIPSNRFYSSLSLCCMIHSVFFLPPYVPFLCLSHPLHMTTSQCLQLVGLCNLSFHWLTSCPELNFYICFIALLPSVESSSLITLEAKYTRRLQCFIVVKLWKLRWGGGGGVE